MHPMLTFIVGLPGETRESVLNTVDILKENDVRTATFFPLVVFTGRSSSRSLQSRVSPTEMDSPRVNPVSEEFLFTSEEFPDSRGADGVHRLTPTATCCSPARES